MKYLSKIIISKQDAAGNGLFDLYKWHKFLWTAFPDSPDANRNFLFRVIEREYEFIVYLLSCDTVKPSEVGSWQTKPIGESIFSHKRYRFELRANPTMRKKFKDNEDSKRVGIYKEDMLHEWINRKAEASGFRIVTLDISKPMNTVFYKQDKDKIRKCTVASVEYKGILDVIDRDKFIKSFCNGIGSGKSFGFGLLVLEPLKY